MKNAEKRQSDRKASRSASRSLVWMHGLCNRGMSTMEKFSNCPWRRFFNKKMYLGQVLTTSTKTALNSGILRLMDILSEHFEYSTENSNALVSLVVFCAGCLLHTADCSGLPNWRLSVSCTLTYWQTFFVPFLTGRRSQEECFRAVSHNFCSRRVTLLSPT